MFGTVYNAYDIGLDRKAYVMDSARISWKDWKYRLRIVYDKYSTNAERKLHKPKRVKTEDWDMFIVICSSKEQKCKRENSKAARRNMKLPHTTGRRGAARITEKKQSVDGNVTRMQLFTALHTHPDGSCPFPESRPILDDINRRVSLDPSIIDRDLDNDVVALATKRDGKGCVKVMGHGISKTSFKASAPYKEALVQEKRKCEEVEVNFGVIMLRLDEETRARKIIEEKLTMHAPSTSGFGNNSQAQWFPPPVEPRETRSSTHCLLKNFKNKTNALGDIQTDIIVSEDLCSVMIDEIFDYAVDLYGTEGTFEEIIAGSTIKWPKILVQMI